MPRGQKSCDKCGATTGPRTKVCQCGNPFIFKPKSMRPQNGHSIKWNELKRGDVIKVLKGSGPYMIIDDEKLCMGYYGRYRVKSLDSTGIHAYPVKAPEGGHCYIYMGRKKRKNKITGIIKRPHKIRKLKQKEK